MSSPGANWAGHYPRVAVLAKHLAVLAVRQDLPWSPTALLWTSGPLRKLHGHLYGNSAPHADQPPPFYRAALAAYLKFRDADPDIVLLTNTTKIIYETLREAHLAPLGLYPECYGSRTGLDAHHPECAVTRGKEPVLDGGAPSGGR